MSEEVLPLFPLQVVLLPDSALPLHIFEERYKQLVEDCLEIDWYFAVSISLWIMTGSASGCYEIKLPFTSDSIKEFGQALVKHCSEPKVVFNMNKIHYVLELVPDI